MAKFKKLAILCTALVMSAGLATAAACAEDAPSSTPSTESSSADSSTPETSDPEDSSSEDSSEDSSGGEATTTYTVTVDAPADVTVGGTLTAAKGEDVTFTLTAANDLLIKVSGAKFVSKEVGAETTVYTYKVEGIIENMTVRVTKAYYRFVETKTVTVNNGYGFTTDLSLDLPEGTYIIKTSNEYAKVGAIAGGEISVYLFDVTDASAPTNLVLNYYEYEGPETADITYSVYEILPIDLTGTTEGSLTLLAGAHIPVSFTAPKAGKYRLSSTVDGLQFGTSYERDIYASDWVTVIGSYTDYDYETKRAQLVELAEGEEIKFYIQASSTAESFVFNYTIEEVVKQTLSTEKATATTLYAYEDTEFTFTASKAGSYLFSTANESVAFGFWNNEYGGYIDYEVSNYSNFIQVELAENETITVYAKYNSYGAPPVGVEISASYLAPSLLVDANTVNVNESVVFRAPGDGYYAITIGENETFSVDGGVTWITETEVYLSAGEEVNIIAKSDVTDATTATVTIETVSYNLYLDYGVEQTVSIKADKTYTVYYSGASDSEEVFISWNNDNVVLKDEEGTEYTSGTVFYNADWSNPTYYLSTKDGSAAEVTLLFNGKQYPALNAGTNTLSVDAETPTKFQYAVAADALGKYTFTVTGASISDVALGAKGYSSFISAPENLSASGSLSITMIEGDMLYLTIASATAENVTVDVTYEEAQITEIGMGNTTIASLKAGEAVFFKTSLEGSFLATWDSKDYTVLAYFDGNASYDEYEFTNGGEEMYIVVANKGNEDVTDIVLNIAKAPTKVTFEDGIPVYLEIPAGEAVIAEGYYLFGTYQVTWDESITNLKVTCNGEVLANGGTFVYSNPYSPCQLQVTTTDGSALNTRILVETYVAPATPLVEGENEVWITAYPGYVVKSFTCDAGTYTISVVGGSTVVVENGEPGYDDLTTFTLANDGDSIDIGVVLQGWNDANVYVTITKTGGEVVGPALPDSNEDLKVGDTTIYMINEDGHSGSVYFTPEEDGTYVFSVEGAVVKTFANLSWRDLADNKLVATAGTKYTLRIVPNDSATTSVVVTITKEAAVEPDPVEAVLGTNAVAVPADKCVKATFTAAEEGTYRITLADGETNAIIKVNGEEITCPAQYELAANESVTFEVWSKLDTDDTIDFVISKYTGTDDPSTDSDEGNWTQNY